MKRFYVAITLVLYSLLPFSAQSSEAYETLQKDSPKLTAQDIDRFVDLVISEGITVEEMHDFQKQLTKQQKQSADKLFLEKVSKRGHVAVDPTQHLVDKEVPLDDASITASCDPGAAPNCWRQNIEEIYLPPSGSYSMTLTEGWYTTTNTCDVNEPDVDYVFAGRRDATNPDKLRWTTTSTQVTYAIELLNGTNINSYGLNLYEARLCLGDNTVSYAGGADKVRANLYTYYIP